jgi:hypothetical protein
LQKRKGQTLATIRKEKTRQGKIAARPQEDYDALDG